MKVIKIKELDLVNTVENILNEQSGGNLIPENGYKAISKIESVYSFTNPKTGEITGGKYTGKEKESYILDYIKSTIGTDNWFKMDELFRTQLYAYMYQTDSNGPMRMWWIAGLAQAIDSKIDRASISKKPLGDPNVDKAINLIKKACKDFSINKYYNSWLKIVDNQYSVTGSAHKDNYKNVWKNRPKAIARLMKGDDWETVKNEFNLETVTAPQQQKTTTQQPAGQQQKVTPQQQKPSPVQQQTQDIASLVDLSENATTTVKVKSPLAVGKYFEFYLQDKTYGCMWKNTINEPYEDDKMRLQLSNRGGQFTVFLVTGDGEKIKMRADGINCKGK
jgi:hypothetical protein